MKVSIMARRLLTVQIAFILFIIFASGSATAQNPPGGKKAMQINTLDGKIVENTLPEYFKGEHDFEFVIPVNNPWWKKIFHETTKDFVDNRLIPAAKTMTGYEDWRWIIVNLKDLQSDELEKTISAEVYWKTEKTVGIGLDFFCRKGSPRTIQSSTHRVYTEYDAASGKLIRENISEREARELNNRYISENRVGWFACQVYESDTMKQIQAAKASGRTDLLSDKLWLGDGKSHYNYCRSNCMGDKRSVCEQLSKQRARQLYNFCQEYAQNAMTQIKEYRQQGFILPDEPLWDDNLSYHEMWCREHTKTECEERAKQRNEKLRGMQRHLIDPIVHINAKGEIID
jgi:hypothetical protein